MSELFYWLLNMSIVASITGCVIMLVRLIKRIPRRIIVILWIIPLLRFLFPVGIGGKYGLMALLSRFITKSVTVYDIFERELTVTNVVGAADSYFPVTYKINILYKIFSAAFIVWAAAAFVLLIAMIIMYVSAFASLYDAEHISGNIYCSDQVDSPAVYGVFRPRIVVPSSYKNAENLDMVLMHEKEHIRRFDNLWRLIAVITAIIHWFNPLAWLFLKLYLNDSEIACDESVLSKLAQDKRKEYAHTLLDFHQVKTIPASPFGGAKIKTRIEHILSFKKLTVFSALGFGVLTAVIAYILLTNAS